MLHTYKYMLHTYKYILHIIHTLPTLEVRELLLSVAILLPATPYSDGFWLWY